MHCSIAFFAQNLPSLLHLLLVEWLIVARFANFLSRFWPICFNSRRIFSIAAVICIPFVLPLNYFGKEMRHQHIPSESLDVFTIGNVKEGSKWYELYQYAYFKQFEFPWVFGSLCFYLQLLSTTIHAFMLPLITSWINRETRSCWLLY